MRRIVLGSLSSAARPLTPIQIQGRLDRAGHRCNIATIYRVTDALEKAGLIHRHPLQGSWIACRFPDQSGRHRLLHCAGCGACRELFDRLLSRREESMARHAGFRPLRYACVCLVGHCDRCVKR